MSLAHGSLYNRYRPSRFEDLVGQEHLVRALQNALTTGKTASGYLFSGPRGTGKTTTARILARCLNCQSSEGPTPEPCGTCDSCLRTGEEGWLDVIEVDAASSARRIDEMRDWLETVRYGPVACRYRVTIMDEAHQIQDQAASALLKTLEEPPEHLVVILCTTHPWDILPTIRSRLQHYGLRKPGVANLVRVLDDVARKEGIETSEPALDLVARAADGSYRDALGLLDQISAFGNGRVGVAEAMDLLGVVERETIFALIDQLSAGDAAHAFESIEDAVESGGDADYLLRALANHLRFVCLLQQGAEPREEWAYSAEELDRLRAQANQFAKSQVIRGLDLIADSQVRIRHGGADPRLQLELIAAKLARPALDASVEAIAARIERLEAGLPAAQPAAAPKSLASPSAVPAAAAPAPAAAPIAGAPALAQEPPPAERPADVAPRPEPVPAASPSAQTIPFEIEPLERAWHRVLATVEAEASRVHVFLHESRPEAVSGDRLRVALGNDFQKRQLSHPNELRSLEAILSRLVGRAVQVELSVSAQPVALEPHEVAPRDHQSLIDEIKSVFDAVEESAATSDEPR